MNTKEKILQAAILLFRRHGYAGTATLAIAKEAGVSEMTLFRYFKSKENLFYEAVDAITADADLSALQSCLTGDPQKDLLRLAEHILHYFMEQNHMIRMMLFESMNQPALLHTLRKTPLRNNDFLCRYFAELQMPDPQQAAELFVSALFGYAIGIRSLQEEPLSDDAVQAFAHSAAQLILLSIRPK